MIRSITVVIPAFNEALSLPETVRRVLKGLPSALPVEVLVVDDGSTDGTSARVGEVTADHRRIRCIAHERNRGKGAALRTGFAHARHDWVLLLDADHQARIDELGPILERGPAGDVVIGYRSWWRNSLSRTLISLAYRLMARLFLGVNVRDVNCPFKLFRRELIQSLPLTSNGFLVDAEILHQLRRSRIPLEQVRVAWHPRAQGASTVRWRHLPELIRELIRLRWAGAAPVQVRARPGASDRTI